MQNIQQLTYYLNNHFDYVNELFVLQGVEGHSCWGETGTT